MTATPDPAELLELLKANDAQFDRCELAGDYTRYSKPDSFSYQPSSATVDEDGMIPKKKRQMLAGIKWPDVAVRHDYVSESGVESYSKWRSIGLEMAHLGPWEGSGDREWYIEKDNKAVALNSYQIGAMRIQFSLGVGYGKRISEIKSIAATDGGYQVEATMDIAADGTSSVARLHIDTDYIVRKAEIESGIMITSFESSGTLGGNNFKCANSGSFERAVKKTRKINSKFDVLLKDVKLGISEERFEHLADLSTPSNEKRFERESGESKYTRTN